MIPRGVEAAGSDEGGVEDTEGYHSIEEVGVSQDRPESVGPARPHHTSLRYHVLYTVLHRPMSRLSFSSIRVQLYAALIQTTGSLQLVCGARCSTYPANQRNRV